MRRSSRIDCATPAIVGRNMLRMGAERPRNASSPVAGSCVVMSCSLALNFIATKQRSILPKSPMPSCRSAADRAVSSGVCERHRSSP